MKKVTSDAHIPFFQETEHNTKETGIIPCVGHACSDVLPSGLDEENGNWECMVKNKSAINSSETLIGKINTVL